MQEDTNPLLGGSSSNAASGGSGAGGGTTGARQRTAAVTTSAAGGGAGATSSAAASPASATVGVCVGTSDNGSRGSGSSGSSCSSVLTKLLLLLHLLVKLLAYPLRKLAQIAFPSGPYDGLTSSTASDRAARDFVASFRSNCLTSSASSSDNSSQSQPPPNPFSTSGYRATLSDVASTSAAPGSGPLLLVYLHSPHHPDCAAFCRNTLANSRMIRYLNDLEAMSSGTQGGRGAGMRCFGASIHGADGQHLAQSLGAVAFPFACLVNVKSSSSSSGSSRSVGGGNGNGGGGPNYSLEVYLRMQGRKLLHLPPDTLLAYLQTVMNHHGASVAEGEARRIQREEETRLRQEQDREYREALEADRAREAERQAEREREERERQEREEKERRAREEKEDALAKAMSLVGDEPPAGTPDTARVRLTLPNGRRIDRRFRADDTLEVVRAFLTVHFHENDVGIVHFSLLTSFPKRTYEDPTITLREGDLVPQAVLMVQDLDS